METGCEIFYFLVVTKRHTVMDGFLEIATETTGTDALSVGKAREGQ